MLSFLVLARASRASSTATRFSASRAWASAASIIARPSGLITARSACSGSTDARRFGPGRAGSKPAARTAAFSEPPNGRFAELSAGHAEPSARPAR